MGKSPLAIIESMGLAFPPPAPPAANYVPYYKIGSMVYISGQLPMVGKDIKFIGKVGQDFTTDEGYDAAELCALNILSQLNQATNQDLSLVRNCVKLTGFVNCTPDFTEQPEVINGASNLMIRVFGDAGKHARAAVGVNALPRGVAVEIEAIFAL